MRGGGGEEKLYLLQSGVFFLGQKLGIVMASSLFSLHLTLNKKPAISGLKKYCS